MRAKLSKAARHIPKGTMQRIFAQNRALRGSIAASLDDQALSLDWLETELTAMARQAWEANGWSPNLCDLTADMMHRIINDEAAFDIWLKVNESLDSLAIWEGEPESSKFLGFKEITN